MMTEMEKPCLGLIIYTFLLFCFFKTCGEMPRAAMRDMQPAASPCFWEVIYYVNLNIYKPATLNP